MELLIEITNTHRQTIRVIDALDECHDPYELLDQLDTIQMKTSSSLNIFISSRHSIQTPNRFALAHVIQHFKSSSDISAFIKGEIHSPSRRVRSGMTPEQALQLHDLLLSRAEGISIIGLRLQRLIYSQYPRTDLQTHPSGQSHAMGSLLF